jgi:uncharacterized membrane protein YfcA
VGYFRGHDISSIGLAIGELALFCLSVVVGGTLGAYLGSNRFSVVTIKRILGVVLAIAGIKLIFN